MSGLLMAMGGTLLEHTRVLATKNIFTGKKGK